MIKTTWYNEKLIHEKYENLNVDSDTTLHKKWKFPLRVSSGNEKTVDLVTFTEEILNGKLHFLCSAMSFGDDHLNDYKTPMGKK